jgi:sugar phosphate isomerase/epimerase
MLTTGLVSVTFRQLSVERIVECVVSAQLDSIEWGGDIHVPHGDVQQARRVAQLTADAGLSVSAYGSYYRLADPASPSIEAVLDTAEALGTSSVRVWAGTRGSADADDAYRHAVLEDAARVVALANQRNLTICLEYHNNTLTDTLASAQTLLDGVDQLRTFWQPPHTYDMDLKLDGLRALLPQITSVHVFHWHPENIARYPLVDGTADWKRYIDILRTSGNDHVLSLEFVVDDDVNNFLQDAQTLHAWLGE